MNAFRGIYRIWATILTAAVVVQIFFAGYGAFDTVDKVSNNGATVDEDSLETSFGAHIGLGYFIFLGTLVFLLISFGTRDRRRIYRALGVVGLVVLQILLAWFGEGVPYVFGGLHPLNAFVILGFLALITYREWKGRAATAEAEPATATTAA
jgi:heme A synthase